MKIKFWAFVIVIMFLTGCKSAKSVSELPAFPLEGTQWNLMSINGENVGDMPSQPHIVFSDGNRISGNLGCNQFFGSYYLNNDKLSVEYTGSTKKMCSEMKTENSFISALKNDINSYRIEGNILIISNKTQELLRFSAQENHE